MLNPLLRKLCTHETCGPLCEALTGTSIFRVTCEVAPLQIDGQIDGTVYYFRERHEKWRLELPQYDLVIAEGITDEGFSIPEAIEIIIIEVRKWMYPE